MTRWTAGTRARAAAALLALAGTGTLAALAPSRALAGTYYAITCRSFDGTLSTQPSYDPNHFGPAPSQTGDDTLAADHCKSSDGGGFLSGSVNGSTSRNSSATWTITSPPDTHIYGVDLFWSHTNSSIGEVLLDTGTGAKAQPSSFGNPDAPLSSGNETKLSVNTPSFSATAICTGFKGCGGSSASAPAAQFRIFRALSTVYDSTAPSGTASGTAAERDTWTGKQLMTLQLADTGSGVYDIELKVDNATKEDVTPSTNGGRCVPVAGGPSAYAFRSIAPCPTSVDYNFSIDPVVLGIPDGTGHTISFVVKDASGAYTYIYTQKKTIDNHPPVLTGQTTLSGTPQVGQTMSCTPPSINGQHPTISYAWLRTRADGSDPEVIDGAVTDAYTLSSADQGGKVQCRVSATDGGGTASSSSSLTAGPFSDGATVDPAPTPPTTSTSTTSTPPPTSTASTTVTTTPPPAPGSGSSGHTTTTTTTPQPVTLTTTAPSSTIGGASSTPPPGSSVDGPPDTKGQPNGRGATPSAVIAAVFARNGLQSSTISYSRSTVIRGHLTNSSGDPIAGATLDVVATPANQGALPLPTVSLRTGDDGSFTLTLPQHLSSRTIAFRYHPELGEDAVGGEAAIALHVQASITLHGRVRHAGSARPTFLFRGRLHGGSYPSPGQLVEIVGKAGHQSVVLGTVRASVHGRFRLVHRVHGYVARGVYTYRAITRTNPAWPYDAGRSRKVTLRVP